jgi:hypothetical protein
MRFVTFDAETYFDSEYTLSRLSTEQYIRDPRFECHGAAIKWAPDQPARWYDARQLKYVLAQEDWSDVFLICHHAAFDGFILSVHYGVVPAMYGCTMSMARLLSPVHLSVSLDAVRLRHGLPSKSTPYNLFRGKHWDELDRYTQEKLAAGCEDEVESIWKIFKTLGQTFPREEYETVDSVIRMFVNPVLQADVPLLAELWKSEEIAKRERYAALDISAEDARSTDKFQALLEAEGVEIEYKDSPPRKDGTRGLIPAFAKTDDFMQNLLEDEDDRIRGLAEARIGAKSTLLQTRAATLGGMAKRGSLPVYLRYCGAVTTRVTGSDGCNWLNFKRGSDLRRSILAPEGFLLGPIDASQIEFRCCMYLANQVDVLEQLRRGEDPYIGIASRFYGEAIYKAAKDDPRKAEMDAKRGSGKVAKLQCQYGASGKSFRRSAKSGNYGPPVDMTLEEAARFVKLYRDTHLAVIQYWKECSKIIARLAGGPPMQWGPFEVKDHKLILPSGQMMHYDTLEFHRPDSGELVSEYDRGGYWRMQVKRGEWKKLFHSKLCQNVMEFVSRVIVSQAMIRIKRQYGIRSLNWPYDELLLLIPDNSKAEETLELCRLELCRTPEWLPEIPLDAEASLGKRYSK